MGDREALHSGRDMKVLAFEGRPYNFDHFRTTHLIADAVGTFRLRGVAPGALAPDFELPVTDGTPWRLSEHRDRPVLLHFGSYS